MVRHTRKTNQLLVSGVRELAEDGHLRLDVGNTVERHGCEMRLDDGHKIQTSQQRNDEDQSIRHCGRRAVVVSLALGCLGACLDGLCCCCGCLVSSRCVRQEREELRR